MKRIFSLVTLAVIVCLSGCKKEADEVAGAANEVNNGGAEKGVAEKLRAAGFDLSQGFFKYQNGYMVEYDIFLTEAQIDELASQESPKSGRTTHYRTTNLVAGLPRTLQVYMDPSFGTYMQNAFDQALARYNVLNTALTFQRTTNASAASISILAFYEVSNTLGFSGGFPTNGNPATTIRLNTYFYNNSSQRPDAATVVAHEIGHAIGFRHTDFMNRAFSCGSGGNEGDAGVGAIHVPGTPTTPSANSWMLACSNNTDRPFTAEDVVSINTLYGASIFGANQTWAGPYYGTRGTFFADVTGDGRADAIVVNEGSTTVRPSTGSGFAANQDWSGAFYGTRGTFFADVTGDGRADAIVSNDGGITVRSSTGTGFADNQNWSGLFFGTRGTFFANVTGVGRADVIAVNDGGITVKASTGTSFGGNETGSNVAYYGTRGTFFADVTGDGRADAIVVNDDGITVRVSLR